MFSGVVPCIFLAVHMFCGLLGFVIAVQIGVRALGR